ncbi:MAG: hypothetical protein JNL77_11580 [Nitrosomonas sp.]|nr:hypothetical protein [Nitrosomonas sp.]
MQNRTTILKAGAYTGFAGAAIFIVQAVFTSTSSTAAIGLIMIPFYGFPAAGAGWALVYSAFALLDLRSGKASWNSRNVQFAAVFLAVFVLAGLGFFAQQRVLAVAKNPASTPQALEVVNQRWIPWGRQGVEIALAQHPSTPPAILEKLAMSGDDAVVQQAGANANMPLAALEGIAAGPPTYERITGLAGNQKISHAIMEKLIAAAMNDSHAADPVRQGLYKTYVLSALAANAALPQDLFERVAASDSPTHFLVLAVINAPRSSCLQMSGLLVSAPALENASLYNTILSKMTGKDCFVEN